MLKDVTGALADLDHAIEINDYNDVAYFLRGSYKCESGDYKGGREDLLKAELLTNPYSLERERSDPFWDVINHLNGRIKPGSKDAGAYLVRGYASYHLGRLDEAIKDFDRAIKLGTSDNLAYIFRGNTKANLSRWYGATTDHKGAMEDYNKAIGLDRKDAEAYNARGIFLREMHMTSQALSDINRAISLNPSSPSFYYSRALLNMQINNDIGALMDLNMALKLDPTFMGAVNTRKDLLKKTRPQPGKEHQSSMFSE